jgi:type IV secretory pathway VirB10-like protein
MLSNRLAFVVLAVACIGAAAGGGYLATRQNTVPAPVAASSAPAPAVTTTAAPASTATPAASAKPVQETEAVIAEAPLPAAPAPKPSAAKPATPPARVSTASPSRSATTTVARREQLPAVTGAAPQPPSAPAPVVVESAPVSPRPDEHAAQEPIRPAEPPARTFAEYVVSAESVIGLQTEIRVSSETARVEDRVEARVTRDVRVGDHVAIPAGARAIGSVMLVERGGKFKEKARLGIRFHTLVLADGTRLPISTETIYRDGEGPGNSTSQKVGGAAVGGAILGAILGGGKGMAIGAAAGAGAGSAAVAAGDRNAATLAAGTSMTVRILQPITVTSERD